MSHDNPGHGDDPIIPTSPRRFGKGLLIVGITLAVGAAIVIPFFDELFANPPPVSQIRTERPPVEKPPVEAGTTTIAILEGAATQGSPDYDPDDAQVPLGNKIIWDNHDTVPHTATSGTGPGADQGKVFDTGILNGGGKSKAIELADVQEGDVIDYFCIVHPYMTSQLTIIAAGGNNQTGGDDVGDGNGSVSGATLNILEGSSVQGNPDFEPDRMNAKVGDEIRVVNQDAIPHTVTSGTGPSDPDKGKAFDTSIINGGDSATISLASVSPGELNYFCIVHPYMTGKLTVE